MNGLGDIAGEETSNPSGPEPDLFSDTYGMPEGMSGTNRKMFR
jgi:hypothetical protein